MKLLHKPSKRHALIIIVLCLLTLHFAGATFFLFYRSQLVNTGDTAIEYFAIGSYSFTDGDLLQLFDMAALAFFVSQASLLALFADRYPIKSYIRIPLALFAVSGLCWIVAKPWQDEWWVTPADYFYLLGTHTLVLIVVLFLIRIRNAIILSFVPDSYQECNNRKES
jgi:hypothetical protein